MRWQKIRSMKARENLLAEEPIIDEPIEEL